MQHSEHNPSAASPPAGRTRRRMLLAATALPLLAVVATQVTAYSLHYDPALGSPIWGSVYAPWKIVEWATAPWAGSVPQVWTNLKIGATVIALACFAGLLMRGRKPQRHEAVHGTARFATRDEIIESGLLPALGREPQPGVAVAAVEDKDGALHYLSHSGMEHVLCLGPLRSGKAVAVVVPTLLQWTDSAIVYDEKGELYEYTSGWRSRIARNVVLRWEPRGESDTIAWNPLDEIRLGSDSEIGDVKNMVEVLADPGAARPDPHFDPVGANFLIGLILHVLYEKAARGQDACLADVWHALNDPSRPADLLYESMVSNHWRGGKSHEEIAESGQMMLNAADRERASIHSTAARFVAIFRDPIVARNTRHSNFRINDLMNYSRPVSLFVVTRGQDKMTMRPLLRLFLTMAMDKLVSASLVIESGMQVSPHKHRLLMLVDEFASLGKMERFQDAMAKCAAYGIKCLLATQGREQIIDAYGPHESITAHCHVIVLFAPNDNATARWASQMAGTTTVVLTDVTESGKRGGWGGKNVSFTYRSVQRPLLTEDEIRTLRLPSKTPDGKRITRAGEVLIFVGGRHAIMAVQSLYFIDPEYLARAAIARVESGRID